MHTIESKPFKDTESAMFFVRENNFDIQTEKHIAMDEGYEHVFIFEYQHKYDKTKVCRVCDLVSVQRKCSDNRIPQLFGFVQVSIKHNS